MIRSILATTALGALLATGAFAQTDGTATDPAASVAGNAPASDPQAMPESGAAPAMAEDAAPEPATEPAIAEEMPEDPGSNPAVVNRDLEDGWETVDATTISAENLIGTDIRTLDGEDIAEVKDVILSKDGAVEGVAASFGGFLGFGSDTVVLSMEELDFVKSPDDELVVRTNLTPEALEGRPPYEG